MAAAGELDQRGVEGGDFWAVAAEQRLAPLLYAAARTGGGIEQVVALDLRSGRRRSSTPRWSSSLAQRAREPDQADARAAYDAVRAFEAQADRTRSSIEATAQALLRAYRFTRVARSAAGCEITADRLLDRRSTLYLIGDAKASKLLRPIFLALLSEVIDRAYERANEQGGRLALPLLVCLDEAGNVAPAPEPRRDRLDRAEPQHPAVSIFHDLAQARSRYRQQAETVVNSHRARMLLPGVADLETLRYFSGLIGEEEHRESTRRSARAAPPLCGQAPAAAARRRGAAPDPRRTRVGALWATGAGSRPAAEWFGDRRLRALASGSPRARRRGSPRARTDRSDRELGNTRRRRAGRSWDDDEPLAGRSTGVASTRRALALVRAPVADVCALRDRYQLPIRSRWWEDQVQLEALAALAAWTDRYDSGEWDDPPGKLALLFDLERIGSLLRDGNEPFHPDRDRHPFSGSPGRSRLPTAAGSLVHMIDLQIAAPGHKLTVQQRANPSKERSEWDS